MITDFETYKEVYDHLEKDHEKIKYRVDYYLPKAIKEFQKATTFPACKWYEYECLKSKKQIHHFLLLRKQKSNKRSKKGLFS